MDIDYKEIATFYSGIISTIFSTCEKVNPSYWDKNNECMKYGDEYLDAYSYLQKAEWRLSNVYTLKDYYTNTDFKYYGLEQLQEVRHRIEHYFNDPDFDLPDYPESVYEYKKYDHIIDYYNRIRGDESARENWNHYDKLVGLVIRKKSYLSDLRFASDRFNDILMKENVTLYDKFDEYLPEGFTGEVESLKERTDKLLKQMEDIQL